MTATGDEPAALPTQARALLSECHTAGLATVDAAGGPRASNLHYALLPGAGLALAVLTDPASGHAQDWAAQPAVALTVFAHPDHPRGKVRGLQAAATVRPGGQEAEQAVLARFPGTPAPQRSGHRPFVLELTWARLLDRAHAMVLEGALDGAAPASRPQQGARSLVVRASEHDWDETVRRLRAAVAASPARVLAEVDHGAGAQAAGLQLRPTLLLLVGNPESGTPLMQRDQTVALQLPLRLLVWQDAGGAVLVGYPDPVLLARQHALGDQVQRLSGMGALLDALASQACGG